MDLRSPDRGDFCASRLALATGRQRGTKAYRLRGITMGGGDGGRVEEAGAVADYVRRAGDQVCRVADHIERRGVEGVLNDAQDFARRRPGAFLLGCTAAGFAVGRLIRGGAVSSGGSDGGAIGERGRPTQTSAYAPPMA